MRVRNMLFRNKSLLKFWKYLLHLFNLLMNQVRIRNIQMIHNLLFFHIVIPIKVKGILVNDRKSRKMIEQEWTFVEIHLSFYN